MLELSWVYVVAAFSVSVLRLVLTSIYAATGIKGYDTATNMILVLSYALSFSSIFCKPRNNTARYKALVVCHFVVQCVMSEIVNLLPAWRDNKVLFALILLRAVLSVVAFWCGMQLRKKVAKLDDEELGKFLTEKVLLLTMQLVAPMVFLSFEAFPCLHDKSVFGSCATALYTTLFLSGNCFVALVFDIVSNAEGKEVAEKVGFSIEKLASWTLGGRQKAQGVGMAAVAVCSMLMLPYIGASEDETWTSFYIGTVGAVAGTVVLCLEASVLIQAANEKRLRRLEREKLKGEREKKKRERALKMSTSTLNPMKSGEVCSSSSGEDESEEESVFGTQDSRDSGAIL